YQQRAEFFLSRGTQGTGIRSLHSSVDARHLTVMHLRTRLSQRVSILPQCCHLSSYILFRYGLVVLVIVAALRHYVTFLAKFVPHYISTFCGTVVLIL